MKIWRTWCESVPRKMPVLRAAPRRAFSIPMTLPSPAPAQVGSDLGNRLGRRSSGERFFRRVKKERAEKDMKGRTSAFSSSLTLNVTAAFLSRAVIASAIFALE